MWLSSQSLTLFSTSTPPRPKPTYRDLQAKEVRNEEKRRQQYEEAEQSMREMSDRRWNDGKEANKKGKKAKASGQEEEDLMGNEGEVLYERKMNYFELILDTY